MKDLSLRIEHSPGALADVGEALGRAGVSIEGGGAFAVDGTGVAHFLIRDADLEAARAALGAKLVFQREVLVQKLDQNTPGQLGALCRKMAASGVNIEVLYSDHSNQLILVVDDPARGSAVSEEWMSRHRAT
jgi:hypothetical protein